jgi:hypothetical protein
LADKDERYVATRTDRFYPGARLSEERKRQIQDLDISADEVTVDDIVFNTAAAYTGTFYLVMGLIEEKWGREAAEEIARSLGRKNGKRNFEKWLENHGVTEGTAELMAKFEDMAHALRGPNHASAVSEYDDDHVVVTRTRCGWHTGRPDGMQSYCRHFSEEAMRSYGEADPAIKEARTVCCMSYGDDHCRHEFFYADPPDEADPEKLRDLWRRGDGDSGPAS